MYWRKVVNILHLFPTFMCKHESQDSGPNTSHLSVILTLLDIYQFHCFVKVNCSECTGTNYRPICFM